MPRDSNSNYTLPPIYLAVTGQTVLAEQHNTPLTDIAAAITGSLARNGTGSMLANLPMGGYRITNIANGIAATDAASLSQVQALGVPVGSVIDFAGAQAPAGFLFCYGQAVSRSDYAELFAVLGTAYGSGNGSTTFNLPDLRGRTTAGVDNMGGTAASRITTATVANPTTLGAAGGAQTHALTGAETGPHSHGFSGTTVSSGGHTHLISLGNGGSGNAPAPSGGFVTTHTTELDGAHTHSFSGTTAAAGSGTAHTNLQPTMLLNKIIRALAA